MTGRLNPDILLPGRRVRQSACDAHADRIGVARKMNIAVQIAEAIAPTGGTAGRDRSAKLAQNPGRDKPSERQSRAFSPGLTAPRCCSNVDRSLSGASFYQNDSF
jgi:hypothetical protein